MPASTIALSTAGTCSRNLSVCSGVQNPITGSTPARLYQLRSKMMTSPAAGKCSTYRCMYICDFCRSVGAGSATTRNTRGLTRSTMRLIVPPLPAVSRPSNTMHTLAPVALTHSCIATSSAWSRASSASYSLAAELRSSTSRTVPVRRGEGRGRSSGQPRLAPAWWCFLDFLPMAGLRRDAVARCARCHHTPSGVRCHHPNRGSRASAVGFARPSLARTHKSPGHRRV